MAEDKTLYVIFGVVAVVALIAMVVLLAPPKSYSDNTLAGQAFSRGIATQRTSAPEYLGPPVSIDESRLDFNHLQNYISPLKSCIRSAANGIKVDVQNQCDPRGCIDQCSLTQGSNQEALKSCSQSCMEDFKSCTTQYKNEFNTHVRSCASNFAPDPVNECTNECEVTTDNLGDFTQCSSVCIKNNWIEPAKGCVDQCNSVIGEPATQEIGAAKEQFTQCTNTCLSDFEQYLN